MAILLLSGLLAAVRATSIDLRENVGELEIADDEDRVGMERLANLYVESLRGELGS